MIVLIEGQLYQAEPLVTTDTDFSIGMDTNGKVNAYIGEKRIDYGVFWRSFNKCLDIDPKTGETSVNGPGKAKIRGIFGDFHRDIELTVNAS